ncbi:MAG: HAD-IB family hydrolase [Actinobacteria bacterium]|nr:HAD-IB family hydrolase [Actinomycetota bacterium]
MIDSTAMEQTHPGIEAAAFFDLDGTLVVGQTQRLLVSFLRAEGMVRFGFLVGVALWFAAYRLGLVKATDAARARGAELMKGMSVSDVAVLMDRFTEEALVPRLHEAAVAALREHQRVGDEVVIVSAALAPVVEALGRRLGVTSCAGTRLEQRGGVYTGRLDGLSLYGTEKSRVALAFATTHGVALENCAAYADHETDVDLLGAVGRPVAVSPRPALARIALERGWPVIP